MKSYIGLIILLTAVFSVRAQTFGANSACATNPPDFNKLSYEEASSAVISEERRNKCPEYVTNLVNELRNGQLDNDRKVLAIWLLGTLRPTDSNSIEFLIEDIDLKAMKLDPKTRVSRWGDYPAEEALIRIGMPAVNPVLNHLTTEPNALRRHLMCEVIVQVEGKKGENFNEAHGRVIAQNQIKQRLADESDSTKQSNLEAALKEIEKGN